MLYLDASVLVKRYIRERGSDAVQARFHESERIFTSALSFAEVHAALGRKYRDRGLRRKDFIEARKRFSEDWLHSLNILELHAGTLAALPQLVERYPLKANDAMHLSAALWLRDTCALVPEYARSGARLAFGVADRTLARVAVRCDLAVFNPERLD